MTSMDDEPKRINVSVAVLEERLQRWAESLQRSIDSLVIELHRRDDQMNDKIGALQLWKVQMESDLTTLRNQLQQVKDELFDRVKVDIEEIKTSKLKAETSFNAKVSLLKSQWTWLVAGAFGMSVFVGLALQLHLIG